MDENQNQNNKRRETIKTILIFFLAILLVLTFFSNTIMNYTLPTVTTHNAYQQNINEKVRGSGTINSKQDYKIKAKGTRKVTSLNVKVGDTVKKGDLIMVLDSAENSETVKSAQDALRSAEVDYQKALLKAAPDYSDDTTGIARAREDLQKAITELDEARRKQGSLITEAANKEATRKSGEATSRQKTLNEYLSSIAAGNYDDLPARYGSSINTAVAAVKDAQRAYDEAKANYEELGGYVSSSSSSSSAGSSVSAGSSAGVGSSASMSSDSSSTDSSVDDLTRKIEDKEVLVNRAKEDYEQNTDPEQELTKKRAWEDSQRELQHLREDLEKAQQAAEDEKKAAAERQEQQQELDFAKQAMLDANDQLTYATNSKDQTVSSVKRMINDDIAALQKEIDAAKEITDAYSSQKSENISTLEEAVTTKQRDLEDKIRKLDQTKKKDANSQKTDDLDLETKRLEVEKKKEALKEAEEKSGTMNIVAENDGVVKELNVAAGDDAPDGTTLATLNLTTAGFVVELSVTENQAKKVKIGTGADVRCSGSNVKAILSGVKTDTANRNGKILVFDLTGEEIVPGETAEMTISCSNQTYDLVVPNSAIQTDNKGKYVLIARSKSTPLGNRYYANRVDVKVLAQDDQYSAVQGDLSSGDAVIKTSEKPLSNGTQIRLEEK